MQRKTNEEWHAELQAQFMRSVEAMVKWQCPLPENFVLYHQVHEHIDKSRHTVQVKSFLTQHACPENCEKVGCKPWSVDNYRVVKGEEPFDFERL
jgi:hypothetical protein